MKFSRIYICIYICNSWLIPKFILNVELSSFCKELWLGSTVLRCPSYIVSS